jgi:hypothetical protein
MRHRDDVDPTSSFADLNETTMRAEESRDPQSHFKSGPWIQDLLKCFWSPADVESEASRVENLMRQELESVDFYITQGYSDIAMDTLDVLEKQFGPQPEIQKRREKLSSASASAATEVFELAEQTIRCDARRDGFSRG